MSHGRSTTRARGMRLLATSAACWPTCAWRFRAWSRRRPSTCSARRPRLSRRTRPRHHPRSLERHAHLLLRSTVDRCSDRRPRSHRLRTAGPLAAGVAASMAIPSCSTSPIAGPSACSTAGSASPRFARAPSLRRPLPRLAPRGAAAGARVLHRARAARARRGPRAARHTRCRCVLVYRAATAAVLEQHGRSGLGSGVAVAPIH